ncbi:MAG: tetratricopeptide repeat protein [Candidatus Methanoperedens sp.]
MTLLDKIFKKKKKDQDNSKKNDTPADARALIEQGNNLVEKMKYAEAVKCYNKALKLTPGSTSALNNKGLALARMERLQAAVWCYNKALKINPDDVDIIFNNGMTLEKMGNYEKAILCYDDILEKKPGDADAWCSKGDVLFKSRSFEEALLAYDRALELAPGDAAVLNNRGLVLYTLNRFSEAVESYDNALKINPEIEKIRSNKNTALAKIKEMRKIKGSPEASSSGNYGEEDLIGYEQVQNAVHETVNFYEKPENLAHITEPDHPGFRQPLSEPDIAGMHRDDTQVTESGSSRYGMYGSEEVQDSEPGNVDDEVAESQPVIPEDEPYTGLRTVIPVDVLSGKETEPLVEQVEEQVAEPEIEPENLDPGTDLHPDDRYLEIKNTPEKQIIKGNSLFSKKKYKEAMDSYNKWGFSGLEE